MNKRGGFVRKPLTPAEIKEIARLYPNNKNNLIAQRLNISSITVRKYGRKLGLHKNPSSDWNKGENSSRWRGGTVGKNGYRYVQGRQLEHRRVMEQHIGRKLERWEQVHHINKVRTDNRLENLKLVTKHTHGAEHRKDFCIHGHAMSGDNLKIYSGHRVCGECHKIRARERVDRQSAEQRQRRLAIIEGVRRDYGKMPVREVAAKYGIGWRSVYRYIDSTPTKLGYL